MRSGASTEASGWMENPFRVDRRSLVVFRVALALLVAWEALTYLVEPDLLTNRGPLPLSVLHADVLPGNGAHWSLYAMSGSTIVVRLLLLVQIALSVCLAAGWHPQVAALGCWALIASAHTRNPLAAHGGDTLLRMELLLASLVPLSARTAVVGGLPVALLLAQPLVMYVVSAVVKCSPSWRDARELSAVHFALHVDMAAKPLARTLREYHSLTRVASLLTPHVELWTPLLLLCPLSALRGPAALLALGVLGALQASFFCCLVLGNFPFVSTIALLPFVPAALWDGIDNTAVCRLSSAPRAAAAGGVVSSGGSARRAGELLRALAALAIGAWVAWWNQAYHCELLRVHATARGWPECVSCVVCGMRLEPPRGALLRLGELLSLQQSWDLFAPEPNREDGYWVRPTHAPSDLIRSRRAWRGRWL